MDDSLIIRVGIADAGVAIASHGSSYAPDLMHDMTARAIEALRGTLQVAIEVGYLDVGGDYELEGDSEEETEEEVTEIGFGIEWI